MREKIIITIAGAMRLKGENISSLSKSTGINRTAISKIVNKGEGTINQIEKVLKYLKVEVE